MVLEDDSSEILLIQHTNVMTCLVDMREGNRSGDIDGVGEGATRQFVSTNCSYELIEFIKEIKYYS